MIPAPNTTLSVTVADGKYTVEQDASGRLYAKRYGEMWRPLTGDGLILALAQAVEAERERVRALAKPAQLFIALQEIIGKVEDGSNNSITIRQEPDGGFALIVGSRSLVRESLEKAIWDCRFGGALTPIAKAEGNTCT